MEPANNEIVDYYLNPATLTNTQNPWFNEFFETVAICCFQPTRDKRTYKWNDTLQSANYSIFMDKMTRLPVVLDAVYSFAHALTGLQKDRCMKDHSSRCLRLDEIPGKELLEAIRSVSFLSPSGRQVGFTNQGKLVYTGCLKESGRY